MIYSHRISVLYTGIENEWGVEDNYNEKVFGRMCLISDSKYNRGEFCGFEK